MDITGTHAAASTESHLPLLLLALLRLQGHTVRSPAATGLRLLGTRARTLADDDGDGGETALASFRDGELISILEAMGDPVDVGGGCCAADSRSSSVLPRTATNRKHDLQSEKGGKKTCSGLELCSYTHIHEVKRTNGNGTHYTGYDINYRFDQHTDTDCWIHFQAAITFVI